MTDPALPPNSISRLWEGVKPCTPGEALTARGLDSVSLDLYRELLKHIPGIKIGTIRAGVITWEWPEQPTPAPPAPTQPELI